MRRAPASYRLAAPRHESSGMAVPVAYDISRLTTRVLKRTPNGIDRIEFAFARHFLEAARHQPMGVMMTLLGPRIHEAASARTVLDRLSAHWGEDDDPERDESYRRIVAAIVAAAAPRDAAARHVARGRGGRAAGVAGWLARYGFPAGRSPVRAVPKGARYLNVGQFPLWEPRYFGWLKARPDVRAAFFIHDLLPIEAPEYFPRGERERHLARMTTLAAFGSGAIVATSVVEAALRRRLAALGRSDMPILVAPMPVAAVFSRRRPADRELAGQRYFVACGTIEPRKNHLLLLNVWRELVRRDGAAAPKLLLVGERGWENENVVDLLERCRGIADHVIEVSGLSTPGLNALLQGAHALLAPSFAEGCGLPVVEALAAGAPVIASDIPSFREIGGDRLVALSPIDGEQWLETIRRFAASPRPARPAPAGTEGSPNAPWDGYFAEIEGFLESL